MSLRACFIGLPVSLRLDIGEFVEMVEDEPAERGQHAAAFDRRGGAPFALEGLARRVDRPVDIDLGPAGDAGDLLAVGGTVDGNGVATIGSAPLAVDQY